MDTQKIVVEEEEEEQTWETIIGLWFILPLLMILSFIYATCEILNGLVGSVNRESELALGLWQMLVVLFELKLFLIFVGCKSLVKSYKFLLIVMGLLTVWCGAAVIGRRISILIYNSDPFYSKDILDPEFRTEDESSINFIGLVINIPAMLIFSFCGWGNLQVMETEDNKVVFWNFNVYSDWIFKYLTINTILSIAIIISTQIFASMVPDALMATFMGVFLMQFGVFTIAYFTKNVFDVMVKTSSDFSPAYMYRSTKSEVQDSKEKYDLI